MSRNTNKKTTKDVPAMSVSKNPLSRIKKQTRHGILAIVFFVLAVFFILAATGFGGMVGVTRPPFCDCNSRNGRVGISRVSKSKSRNGCGTCGIRGPVP